MNADGLFSIAAPTVAEIHDYYNSGRFAEDAFRIVTQHAERLMAGAPVRVVEVPRIVDLDVERTRRRS